VNFCDKFGGFIAQNVAVKMFAFALRAFFQL
jgi:hypothetical protein